MPPERKKILVVEDDRALAVGLDLNLEAEGYEVKVARDGVEGLALAGSWAPDLVVLDLLLPEMDGYEVLERLRDQGSEVPVIVLSARTREEDKVRGLDLGADDYVTKPFGLKELLARIHAALRRQGKLEEKAAWVHVGDVRIERRARRVWRGDRPVTLTSREYALLDHFVRHPGRVFSRDQLLAAVWGPDYEGTARTVDNFVRRLRVKLEARPEAPEHLLTVHGIGYRFEL